MGQLLILYYYTSKKTTPIFNYNYVSHFCYYSNRLDRFVESLCSICYHILSKSQSSPFSHKLLLSLSVSSTVLKQLWSSITTMTIKRTFGPSVMVLDQFRRGLSLPTHEGNTILYKLTTFSVLLFVSLSSLHDIEVFTKGPFTMADLCAVTLKLRDVFVNINLNNHLYSVMNASSLNERHLGVSDMKFLSNVSTDT